MRPPADVLRYPYRWSRRLGVVDAMWLLHASADQLRHDDSVCPYPIRAVTLDALRSLRAGGGVDPQVGDGRGMAGGTATLLGAFHGDRLISFLWLAHGTVAAEENYCRAKHLGVSIGLPKGYAFVFNAWTDPDRRGRQLIAHILRRAIASYLPNGTSLVTTIDWTNDRSCRAFERIGLQRIGLITRIGKGRLQLSVVPDQVSDLGLRIADDAPGFKWRR